jgi:hypothetical protein
MIIIITIKVHEIKMSFKNFPGNNQALIASSFIQIFPSFRGNGGNPGVSNISRNAEKKSVDQPAG